MNTNVRSAHCRIKQQPGNSNTELVKDHRACVYIPFRFKKRMVEEIDRVAVLERAKTVGQLRRLHEKVANTRMDALNKVAYQLVKQYGSIALEDLQIMNTVRNHNLAKSIVDGGWGFLKTHLALEAKELVAS